MREIPNIGSMAEGENNPVSFEDYFTEEIMYPDASLLVDEILPVNTLLTDIPHCFLDAFINHVKMIRIWLIRRYTHPAISQEEGEYSVLIKYTILIKKEDLPLLGELLKQAELLNDNGIWQEYAFDNFEAFIKTWLKANHFHVKFCELHDDVLVLARSTSYYWFFWFDLDPSDCCIGRFQTSDSEKQVIERFDKYVSNTQEEYNSTFKLDTEPILIPPEKLQGWISS